MENIKIKISKEQAELFEKTGNRAVLSDKDVYMSIPYWLKETDEEYVYEYLTVEQLPDNIRNYQPRYSEEDLREAFYNGWLLSSSGASFRNAIEKWFEPFKKNRLTVQTRITNDNINVTKIN